MKTKRHSFPENHMGYDLNADEFEQMASFQDENKEIRKDNDSNGK